MNLKMLVLEANSTVSLPVLIGYTGEETRYDTKQKSSICGSYSDCSCGSRQMVSLGHVWLGDLSLMKG